MVENKDLKIMCFVSIGLHIVEVIFLFRILDKLL